MSQTAPKITIRNKKPGNLSVGANTEVLIDGKPLPYVTFIKVEVGARKTAKVLIEMVGEVDVELDSIPHIKVEKEKPGPQWNLGSLTPLTENVVDCPRHGKMWCSCKK